VANNDQYTVTFSGSGNSYTLQYSGSNPALVNLPSTPWRSPTDPASRQIQRLADLPSVTASVNLVAAADVSSTLMTAVTNVQFNGLGGTTRSDPTWIWLASGAGSNRCYLVVTINPVTGLTSIGTCTGAAPATSLLLAAGHNRERWESLVGSTSRGTKRCSRVVVRSLAQSNRTTYGTHRTDTPYTSYTSHNSYAAIMLARVLRRAQFPLTPTLSRRERGTSQET
jgi:hypothetical protein